LKTRRFGYDGKGQVVIRTPEDAAKAWEKLGGRPLILEGFVPFDRELSVIAVRGRDGQIVTDPLFVNERRDGILHRSVPPPGAAAAGGPAAPGRPPTPPRQEPAAEPEGRPRHAAGRHRGRAGGPPARVGPGVRPNRLAATPQAARGRRLRRRGESRSRSRRAR